MNGDSPGKQQFLNWMTVDQVTGYLYFIFYDRRNYTNYLTDVYIARSTDGGETFENVRISASPFYCIPYVFFGDYINISAHNNKIRPIWTRIEGSYTSIWTAIIDTFNVGVRKTSSRIPESHQLYQNYPNPFNPVTNINFDISKNSYVKLIVFNILGEKATTLINEKLNAGSYTIVWNAADYPSGIYFYRIAIHSDRLGTKDYAITRKMLLIK